MPLRQVFVVWDDEDVVHMFRLVFEQVDCAVSSASSYSAGLDKCMRNPPDLLIIKRFIQQSDGLEFCVQVRGTDSLSGVPIIVGEADLGRLNWEECYQRAYDAGANACFGRVFDIMDVLEQVAILLADPTVTDLIDRQTMRIHRRRLVDNRG